MFDLELNVFEVVARTLIIYVVLLVALRLAGKREIGQMTPFDLVVILLISEAVQNAMVGGDMSLTGGLIAAGVLIGANYTLAVARDRVPFLREAIEGSPTIVVSHGEFLRKEMQREGLDEDEIRMAIRQHGIEDVGSVRLAVMETDGTISVIPMQEGEQPGARRRRRAFSKKR